MCQLILFLPPSLVNLFLLVARSLLGVEEESSDETKLGGHVSSLWNHVGVKPLAFIDYVGGKVPNLNIMLGIKPANGYHSSIVSLSVSSSCKNEMDTPSIVFLCFKLV
jgi:hypothetical protein